jgi:Tol biopolymer transport system component
MDLISHENEYIQNIKCLFLILSFLFLIIKDSDAQTFKVKGNISTSTGSVKFASVTFVDNNDSTKRYTTLTDTSGNYKLDVLITGINEKNSNLPAKFELIQNYPNPFSTTTTITYKLNVQSDVNIKIYNILGQVVKSLGLTSQSRGTYGIVWDGTNNLGKRVTPGVYFYQIIAGNESKTKKMLFGFSGSNDNRLYLSERSSEKNIQSSVGELKKTNYLSSIDKNYTVYLQNTDSTNPLVDCAKFSITLTQHDTTLDYSVNNFDLTLCYTRTDTVSYRWQIYLNNISGTNLKSITNPEYDYYSPSWSPDGKYIALWSGSRLYAYDVYKDSLVLLPTTLGGTQPLLWTSDSKKIIYSSGSNVYNLGAYVIDVDGNNFRKINYPVNYLYSDNYNTIYIITSSTHSPLVYHSNLDGTVNEFIVDLGQYVSINSGSVSIQDYDPIANSLLLAFDDPSTALPNFIGKYDIDKRQLDTIVVSEIGWKYYKPKFSSDYKSLALTEVYAGKDTTSVGTYRVSLFENNTRAAIADTGVTLVEFRENNSFLDFNPFAFSKDDKYFAFVKDIVQPGTCACWKSYVYVVRLDNKQQTFIGMGITPIWNPLIKY